MSIVISLQHIALVTVEESKIIVSYLSNVSVQKYVRIAVHPEPSLRKA